MDNHKLPHHSSKLSQTKSVHPSSYSSRAFQRYQEHSMKCHDLSAYKLGIPIAIYSFPSIDWLWAKWEQVFSSAEHWVPNACASLWSAPKNKFGMWNFAKFCTWKIWIQPIQSTFHGEKKNPNSSNFEEKNFKLPNFMISSNR